MKALALGAGVLLAVSLVPALASATPQSDALSQAVQALKGGKPELTIRIVTAILGDRKLTAAELAKGLYLRGAAYEKSGKPAQAIADLSSALWLRDLAGADRADATKLRAAALQSVGLAGKSGGGAAVQQSAAAAIVAPDAATPAASWSAESVPAAGSSEKKTAVPAGDSGWSVPAVVAPASGSGGAAIEPPMQPAPAGGGITGFFDNLFYGGSQPAPAVAPAVAPVISPVVAAAGSDWSPAIVSSKKVGAPPAKPAGAWATASLAEAEPVVVSKPKSAPALSSWNVASNSDPVAAPAPSAAANSSTVGGFFSSLFGGGSAASPDATASIATPAKAEPNPYDAQPASAAGFATEVVKADVAEHYLLQVGSAANPNEARAIAAKVAAADPTLAASYRPQVLQTAAAGGKPYLVNLGPFPDERASLEACVRLKRAGVSCFLVVR